MGSPEDEFQSEQSFAQGPPPMVNPGMVVLYALGRSPLLIAALTAVGTLAALVVAFSQPNMYRSAGMLLVRMGARELQTPEVAVNPDSSAPRSGTATGDELILLMDPALQARVVQKVGAEWIMTPYNPSAEDHEGTPFHVRKFHQFQAWLMGFQPQDSSANEELSSPELIEAATEEIAHGTLISPQRRSNTILVSYTAHSKELAQAVATAYISVMQERHREFYESSDTYTFVSKRLEEANTSADTAHRILLEQRQKDGIYDLAAHTEALALEVQELTKEHEQARIRLQGLSRQLTVLNEQLAETPEELDWTTTTDESPAPNEHVEPKEIGDTVQYTITELRVQLLDTDTRLAALDLEYTAESAYHQQRSRQLLRHRARIEDLILAQLKTPDKSASQNLLLSGTVSPTRQLNPTYLDLLSEQLNLSRELEALAVGADALSVLLEKRKDALKELVLLGPTYARLARIVAKTEERASRLDSARSKSATLNLIDSEESMGSLLVTQEPFLPREKEGPNRAKILLLGVFGGLAAGVGIAILRHLLDSRLRFPVETELALGVRVLGTLPEQPGWHRSGARTR